MLIGLIEKKHTLKIIAFFSFFILFSSKLSFAQEEQFSVDYNLDYSIGIDGEASVVHEAIITNLQNDSIPTNYSFSSKQLNIYDVSVLSNDKEVNPQVDEFGGSTKVMVTIRDHAIGKGRQNKIVLKYKTKSIVSKSGNIWNLYLPKIQVPEKTTLYNVKISVPKSFGKKIYISPAPVIEKAEEDSNSYYFTNEVLKTAGITAAFGEYQPVNFRLKYQIQNNSILPSIKKIALPPDIKKSQSVSYKKLDPKPHKLKIDKDGNLIAYYILKPKKNLEVEVIGTAKLYGEQINPDFGRGFNELPKDIVKNYTKPKEYWETKSPYIQKVVQELKNEDLSVTKNAQKIYNFIVQNIKYDFNAASNGLVERVGAEAVITREGKWTCMEFTDLFIALSRASGIPAREVNGYAFTPDDNSKPLSISFNKGDFLHSWAEFYDPFYGWVQVDPTWGATSGVDYFSKLDTGHFAFVIKGLSSKYPYPAGSYRFSENGKLIEVDLSKNMSEEYFMPAVSIKKVTNFNPIQIIKGKLKLKIENTGNITIYNLDRKILPTRSHTYLYVDGDSNTIHFEDIDGNKYQAGF